MFYVGKSFRNILNLNIEIIESNWNSSGLLLDLLYMPGSELFCRIQGAIGKDDYNCTDEILISYVNSAKNSLTVITHSYFLVICV